MSLRLLRSVRFNIFLFLVIAGACALGTFLPQAGEVPEKVQEFLVLHPSLGPVLERLGLFNLFYSTWFMALLGLMAFDIVVCKLHRKPPDPGLVRLPQEEDEKPLAENALLAKPFRGRLGSPLPLEMAAAAAGGVLGARGYAVEVSRAQGKVLVTGTRHRLQRWGSYVSHVSLVVILLGALVKALFGFEEMLPILEGTSRVMKHQPWEVFVDRFEMKTYPGTRTPSLFASDLRVVDVSMEALAQAGDFEDGKLLAKKRIVVNDPVSVPVGPFQRVKLYQASWGAGGMFRSVTLQLGRRRIVLPQRTRKAIPGTEIEVEADLLLPDFTVGKGNVPDTKGLDLENPAVRFVFHHRGRRTSPLWLFERWPDTSFVERNGVLHTAPPPPFRIAGLDPVLFSGIQAAYDPGFPVVMSGSVGMLVGLSLLFYLHRRRVWVLCAAEGEGTRVTAAGWSSRGGGTFDAEFERLRSGLEAALGAPRAALSEAPGEAAPTREAVAPLA